MRSILVATYVERFHLCTTLEDVRFIRALGKQEIKFSGTLQSSDTYTRTVSLFIWYKKYSHLKILLRGHSSKTPEGGKKIQFLVGRLC